MWVIHTYQVIQATNNILIDEYEAITLARGYLITGDESMLLDVQPKIDAMMKDYLTAKQLVVDNPEQIIKFNKLQALLNERVKAMLDTIQLKKSKKIVSPEGIILINYGQQHSHEIKLLIENIIGTELQLLERRTNTAKDSLSTTLNSTTLADIFGLLSLLTIIILFDKQLSAAVISKNASHRTENLLKGIINGTNDLILALDTDFKIIAFNQSMFDEIKKIYGKKIKIGMSIQEALESVPQDAKMATDLWANALLGEEFTVIGTFGNPELTRNQYEISYSSIYNEKGNLIGASCLARNIMKRIEAEKVAELARKDLENAFKVLKEHDEIISIINEMSNILQLSNSLEETLSLIGKYCTRLLPFAAGIIYVLNPSHNYLESLTEWNHPDIEEKVIFPDQCWGLREGKVYRYLNDKKNIACKHAIGKTGTPYYICIPLLGHNEIIGLLYLEIKGLKSMTDNAIHEFINQNELLITTLASNISISITNIKLRDSLRMRALHDPLTGLYNRLYLNESLNKDIQRAKRQNITLAIIMMDVDHFKEVNDTFGHEAGDFVLKEVSNLILKNTRKSDIVCRYGGEEFLLMYYDVSQDSALKAIEQLRVDISKMNLTLGTQSIRTITASFGLSIYPTHGETSSELISAADKALYQSKESGRNKTTIYQSIE